MGDRTWLDWSVGRRISWRSFSRPRRGYWPRPPIRCVGSGTRVLDRHFMSTFARPTQAAVTRRSFFAHSRNMFIQQKCGCGGAPGATGEYEQCRKKRGSEPLGQSGGHDFSRIAVGLQQKLAINQPDDRFEQEADRMAEYAVNGAGSIASPSLSPIT